MIAVELYEQQARSFVTGEFIKVWKHIDANCIFLDENHKRQSMPEILTRSRKLLSSSRDARVNYKIYNAVWNGDFLVVHSGAEVRFETRKAGLMGEEEWVPYIKTQMELQTWQRNEKNDWQVVVSRRLRPDASREDTGSSAKRKLNDDLVKRIPLSPCVTQCSETAVHCGGVPDKALVNPNCAREYSACVNGCRGGTGATATNTKGLQDEPIALGRQKTHSANKQRPPQDDDTPTDRNSPILRIGPPNGPHIDLRVR